MTSHDESPRTSKLSSPSEEPDSRILKGYCGVKELNNPGHFIQSPRPMPRRKKRPRMNKESPNCQETSLRTILSSANRDHKKEERHAIKGSLPGYPKKKD